MRIEIRRNLTDRKAFVLGGTGGIGRATARALGLRGASVDIHGRDSGKLDAALREFRREGITAGGTAGELVVLDDALPLRKRAESADILVIAWGPFLQKPLHETTPEDWKRLADFDFALPGVLVSAALSGMRERKWGRILLFGGTRTDGIRGFRTNAAYAAAKTSLGTLAKSISAQYAPHGVAALVLCPGFVETEYLTPEQKRNLTTRAPQGRLTRPDDIGDLAAVLLAQDPPLWNGAVLTADEGLFAW